MAFLRSLVFVFALAGFWPAAMALTDCDADELDLCDTTECDADELDLCDDHVGSGSPTECDADELDLCDYKTATTTSTTTAGDSGSATTLTTAGDSGSDSTTAAPKKTVSIQGQTVLQMADADAEKFMVDESAKTGVKQAIAKNANALLSEVDVTFTLVNARRRLSLQQNGKARRLASSVQVDFTITKEVADAAEAETMGQTFSSNLASISTEDLAADIMAEVQEAGGDAYQLEVTSFTKEEPVVKDVVVPGTTTSEEATTNRPDDDETDEADSGRKNSTPSAALLVVLLAGLCSVSMTKNERERVAPGTALTCGSSGKAFAV